MSEPDILVLGGGLAGLAAAATLLEAGRTPLVLEAQADFGGRIRTLCDPSTGTALADLGPTWVWPPYQPVVAEWLQRLGLSTFPQYNTGDAVLEGYAPGLRHQPLPGQEGILRIAGGPGAMIRALEARIGAGHLRSGARVRGVQADGAAEVAVTLGSGARLVARGAIVALPPRIAAGLDLPWADEALLGTLRQTPTWMAAQAKAVALYDRPFWRARRLSGRIASRLGPLVEVHDHCAAAGQPALFGFVGWPHAARAADPAGLRAAILAQLAACLGLEAGQPQQLHIEDWAQNPDVAAPLDLAEAPEHPQVRPALLRAAHLGGRLWFGGSEVAALSPGLIEGALEGGQSAAKAALRGLWGA